MHFRETNAEEIESVQRVHRLAFGHEDEAILVERLLNDPSAQPSLSVVAEAAGDIVGHALFTALTLVGSETPVACSILAPLAVLPTHQKSGIGRGLVEYGCRILSERDIGLVFVLGNPLVYTRCGFVPAAPHGLHAPYAIEPVEAWMVRPLRPQTLGNVHGTVQCAQTLAVEHYWRE